MLPAGAHRRRVSRGGYVWSTQWATLISGTRRGRRGNRVRSPGGEQVWAGPQPSAVASALKALATSYTVVMSRPVRMRTRWMDTADWRLYRKGLALTARAPEDGDDYTLELSDPDGGILTAGSDTRGWPRLLAGLPEPLRANLEPIVGIRALMPVVQVSGAIASGSLLDAEDKIVVRLVQHRPATLSGGVEKVPGRLHLIGVRGYASH